MAAEHLIDRVSRELDINGRQLVIDEHTEMENEAGAVVWDAALVLLQYFCTGTAAVTCTSGSPPLDVLVFALSAQRNSFAVPKLVKGKRIIELGAGTGVVGLAAAMLGAEVVITGKCCPCC